MRVMTLSYLLESYLEFKTVAKFMYSWKNTTKKRSLRSRMRIVTCNLRCSNCLYRTGKNGRSAAKVGTFFKFLIKAYIAGWILNHALTILSMHTVFIAGSKFLK